MWLFAKLWVYSIEGSCAMGLKIKLWNKSKLGEKLNNFFYFDLQAPIFGGLYLLEKGGG